MWNCCFRRRAGPILTIIRPRARYLGIKAGGAGDKKKLEYLIQFSKAMPHEHNLIDYVAGHVLKINPEKGESL